MYLTNYNQRLVILSLQIIFLYTFLRERNIGGREEIRRVTEYCELLVVAVDLGEA